jgi:hypothetical protein
MFLAAATMSYNHLASSRLQRDGPLVSGTAPSQNPPKTELQLSLRGLVFLFVLLL